MIHRPAESAALIPRLGRPKRERARDVDHPVEALDEGESPIGAIVKDEVRSHPIRDAGPHLSRVPVVRLWGTGERGAVLQPAEAYSACILSAGKLPVASEICFTSTLDICVLPKTSIR